MSVLKVKVISLPYIFQVLYVLCFTRTRNQVSVYRTIGPLVNINVFAKFDEIPSMILQDIKERKHYGHTVGKTDNVKTPVPQISASHMRNSAQHMRNSASACGIFAESMWNFCGIHAEFRNALRNSAKVSQHAEFVPHPTSEYFPHLYGKFAENSDLVFFT